jgi:hypothetical protein
MRKLLPVYCFVVVSRPRYHSGLIVRTIQRLLPKAVLFTAVLLPGAALYAQSAVQGMLEVDATQLQALPNHLPHWANPSNDVGPMPPKQLLPQLTIVLSRSPERESAFEKLLADQQNPVSPNYHH